MQLGKDPSWLIAESVYNCFLLLIGDGRQIAADVQVSIKMASVKKHSAILLYRDLPNGREGRYVWIGAYGKPNVITLTMADKAGCAEEENLGYIFNKDATEVTLQYSQYHEAARLAYNFLIGA